MSQKKHAGFWSFLGFMVFFAASALGATLSLMSPERQVQVLQMHMLNGHMLRR